MMHRLFQEIKVYYRKSVKLFNSCIKLTDSP